MFWRHSCLVGVGLAFQFANLSSGLAANNQVIPAGELGNRASGLLKPGAQAVMATSDGARLTAPLQDLVGNLTPVGITIESVGSSEGGGQLKLTPQILGRGSSSTQSLAATGTVRIEGQVAQLERGLLTEKFSTSGDGIRQDFVINQRFAGAGNLSLELVLTGAQAVQKGERIRLTLNESGRVLSYGNLRVTDADGKKLPAQLRVLAADRLEIMIQDQDARYPLMIDPTFSDDDWVNIGFGPFAGTNWSVSALTFGNGVLYVGGGFSAAGEVVADHIVEWDGSSWRALGLGTNDNVYALALDKTGNLYAGGSFTQAGGITVNGVARWDGNNWHALGAGVSDCTFVCVRALILDNVGNVYVGGDFTRAGGVVANHIAKWEGTSWHTLSTGISGYENSSVYALALDSASNLYVGGYFGQAGGIATNSIAQWNGNNWRDIGATLSSSFFSVYALAVDASDNLYAGGNFAQADAVAKYIARWDGSVWHSLGSGVFGCGDYFHFTCTINSIVLDGTGNLYIGGNLLEAGGVTVNKIAKWDGTSWYALGSGIFGSSVNENSSVFALSVDNFGNLYAGGLFSQAGEVAASYIAQWDGAAWKTLGSGSASANDRVNALTLDNFGKLYVGGYFTQIAGVMVNNIACWDGSTWRALGSGVSGVSYAFAYPEVYSIVVDNSGNVYAGGSFLQAGGITVNNVARWDGVNWNALGSGVYDTGGYPSVRALSVDSMGKLYVGGNFKNAGKVKANNIAQWTGVRWNALGSGISGDYPIVYAVAVDGVGKLYVGGSFEKAGGVTVKNVARWDGKQWKALGSGIDGGNVVALAVDDAGNLYAGGMSVQVVEIGYISRWDGTTWKNLGDLSGVVSAIVLDDAENLYAGGWFDQAGKVSANHIVQWDGKQWNALGSGTNYGVSALALDKTSKHLYVGGIFTVAGGRFTNSVAQYNLSTASQYQIVVTANPATGGTAIGGGSFLAGKNVTVVAKPNINWDFLNWTEGGTVVSTRLRYTFTVTANRSLVAQFAQKNYHLKVKKTGRGKVTSSPSGINCGADCEQDYQRGKQVTLIAKPVAGWVFNGWSGDCTGTVICKILMDQDHTVNAKFIQQ